LPNIAPKLSIITIKPKVLPIPFSTEITASPIFIPSAIATDRETITKDKKELNFSTRIRNKRRQIPRITIMSGITCYLWVLIDIS
jgi:hypothetical protein